jgi:hypothetical protein
MVKFKTGIVVFQDFQKDAESKVRINVLVDSTGTHARRSSLQEFISSDGDGKRFNLLLPGGAITTEGQDGYERYYEDQVNLQLPANTPNRSARRERALAAIRGMINEYADISEVFLPLVRQRLDELFGPTVHVLRHPSFLASEPGARAQTPHTDVVLNSVMGNAPGTSERARQERLHFARQTRDTWSLAARGGAEPLSILGAFEESTRLFVWPSSHKTVWPFVCDEAQGRPADLASEPVAVEIKPGQACIFSGALVHAGAPNLLNEPHCRFHVYADVVEAKTEDHPLYRHFNSTGLVANYGAHEAYILPPSSGRDATRPRTRKRTRSRARSRSR